MSFETDEWSRLRTFEGTLLPHANASSFYRQRAGFVLRTAHTQCRMWLLRESQLLLYPEYDPHSGFPFAIYDSASTRKGSM